MIIPPVEENNSPFTLHSTIFVVLRETLGPLLLLLALRSAGGTVEKSVFVYRF